MDKDRKPGKGYGLFRSYGLKNNLIRIAAGFLLCLALDFLSTAVSSQELLSRFDPSIAIMPLVGILLGIWGVIGCVAEQVVSGIYQAMREGILDGGFVNILLRTSVISTSVYCALPCFLWYRIPVRGEKKISYPRLDTSAHVIKYYLIMIVTAAIYLPLSMIAYWDVLHYISLSEWAVTFTQYLNVILIIGIPVVIVVSLIRNRTITINERMVLAFLIIGVMAAALCAIVLYQNTVYLKPDLEASYEAAIERFFADTATEADNVTMDQYDKLWNWFYLATALMLNTLLIVEMVLMRAIEKKVTRPLLHLTDALENYTDNKEKGLNTEAVSVECGPYTTGYGEVSSLVRTCVNMVDEIDSYTENLKHVTAEKERIGTELDVASKIQRDMLPCIFPPFPDRAEIDLFASMTPAREVGGDFYDFYFIDQDHLALTIADVSGKGVPAALFMVISKTLLKHHAQTGQSPKEILTYVNHQLCENNSSFMFCTVWLGILNVKTGKLTASNGGHEYPAVKRTGGKFELIKGRHDPALGIRDGIRYHEYELTLYPGDCIFQYTDGVTEATAASQELFGEERLKDSLNLEPQASPEVLIRNMHESIDGFVGNAPQFDDITMICVKYIGSGEAAAGEKKSLTVPARVDALDQVTAFAEENLEAAGCPMDTMLAVTLAIEEIFVNIADYAYDGKDGEAKITFSFDEDTKTVEFVFMDEGIPYDPTSKASPDITLAPSKRQIGGLGIHIVKNTMDQVTYEYAGGRNILTIRKKIG